MRVGLKWVKQSMIVSLAYFRNRLLPNNINERFSQFLSRPAFLLSSFLFITFFLLLLLWLWHCCCYFWYHFYHIYHLSFIIKSCCASSYILIIKGITFFTRITVFRAFHSLGNQRGYSPLTTEEKTETVTRGVL